MTNLGTRDTRETAWTDRVFLSKSFPELCRVRGALYAGFAATWLFVLYRFAREGDIRSDSAGFGLGTVTAWDYAWTQAGVIVHYVRLSFWPHPLAVGKGQLLKILLSTKNLLTRRRRRV